MSRPYADALAVSRKVLRLAIKLNLLIGVAILALLIASLIAEGQVMGALGAKPSSVLYLGMRLTMVIGILSVPLVHMVLTRLLEMVETARFRSPAGSSCCCCSSWRACSGRER